jgi:hypothetical protein
MGKIIKYREGIRFVILLIISLMGSQTILAQIGTTALKLVSHNFSEEWGQLATDDSSDNNDFFYTLQNLATIYSPISNNPTELHAHHVTFDWVS